MTAAATQPMLLNTEAFICEAAKQTFPAAHFKTWQTVGNQGCLVASQGATSAIHPRLQLASAPPTISLANNSW